MAEVMFAAGTHELYQLLPLDDPAAGRRLAGLLRDEATVAGDGDAEVRFRWFDEARPAARPTPRCARWAPSSRTRRSSSTAPGR